MSRLGFCLFADGPCQSHRMFEIGFFFLKKGMCGRARINPGNVKDGDAPQRPKGRKVGKDPCCWLCSRQHSHLLNASVSQSVFVWLQPFQCRTVDLPAALFHHLRHTRTSLSFCLGEDFHSYNDLDPNGDLNQILTSTLTPRVELKQRPLELRTSKNVLTSHVLPLLVECRCWSSV